MPDAHKQVHISQERVVRVRAKLGKLKAALSEAEKELSSRRQKSAKAKKESSDGKTTAKQRQDSKEYRDKHKTELSSKAKKSSGGSKSSSSVADMSEHELRARVIKIRGAITVARRLLSSATLEHGQLAHSAIVSEPNVNERFARFQSAERGPSR